jgi:hypothetical protein
MRIEETPEYIQEKERYGTFDPYITQSTFALAIARQVVSERRLMGLEIPDIMMRKLRRLEAYIAVQINRWGIDALNEGSDIVFERRPDWEELKQLLTSDID